MKRKKYYPFYRSEENMSETDFETTFPSLKNKLVEVSKVPTKKYYQEKDIWENCLDKQKVVNTIQDKIDLLEKHKISRRFLHDLIAELDLSMPIY